MTPSPNEAGGGSSIVCSTRVGELAEVADLHPKLRQQRRKLPAPARRRSRAAACAADAIASISRGFSERWAARLASRSRSGSDPTRLAKLLPDGPSLDQPGDGVVARLDRRPVEQRLGQPAPQHPGAHRRPRQVDRRQQRALALAVTEALGQLQAAPG